MLHAKHFTVDDMVGIIGSSNMDYRSFGLDYEITLMSTGEQFVADLQGRRRVSGGLPRVDDGRMERAVEG